jgi:hypothetical protein
VSPELKSIVENAYREFADYRLTGPLTVCRCPVCVDAQAERELRSVALREMPARLLAEYTHSAHGCEDRAADELRYFLPRYFELIALGDPPSNIGIETCLGRLHDARWRTRWPAAEAAVIEAFLMALLRARLAAPPPIDPTGCPVFESDQVEDVLCMATHAGADLAGLLALCDAERGRAVTLHIANIVSKADWRRQRLENVFWHDSSLRPHIEIAMRAVLSWLLTPEMRERLEDACLAEPDEAAARLLSHAEGLVMSAIRKGIDDQLRR